MNLIQDKCKVENPCRVIVYFLLDLCNCSMVVFLFCATYRRILLVYIELELVSNLLVLVQRTLGVGQRETSVVLLQGEIYRHSQGIGGHCCLQLICVLICGVNKMRLICSPNHLLCNTWLRYCSKTSQPTLWTSIFVSRRVKTLT